MRAPRLRWSAPVERIGNEIIHSTVSRLGKGCGAVIDALERLQESELMVGVITHVPALAERIKVGVRIEKDQGKSTVRIADAA